MSVHYIIDGYNVIKQVTFLTGKKLKTGREGLLRLIETYKPQGSSRNEVTVVFDGRAEISSLHPQTSVGVIFSKGESADEKIKKMVEKSSNPRRIVVVSDDKQITYYCRAHGAKIKSVQEFLGRISTAKKNHIPPKDDDKPKLGSKLALAITAQLEDVWLKKNK